MGQATADDPAPRAIDDEDREGSEGFQRKLELQTDGELTWHQGLQRGQSSEWIPRY